MAIKPEVLKGAVVGVSAALILSGIWELWGWGWAAIAAGTPAVVFYLIGELRVARYGIIERESD